MYSLCHTDRIWGSAVGTCFTPSSPLISPSCWKGSSHLVLLQCCRLCYLLPRSSLFLSHAQTIQKSIGLESSKEVTCVNSFNVFPSSMALCLRHCHSFPNLSAPRFSGIEELRFHQAECPDTTGITKKCVFIYLILPVLT